MGRPHGLAVVRALPYTTSLPRVQIAILAQLRRHPVELEARKSDADRARLAADLIRRSGHIALRDAARQALLELIANGSDQSRREAVLACHGLASDQRLHGSIVTAARQGPWFVREAAQQVLGARRGTSSGAQSFGAKALRASSARVVQASLPTQRRASPRRVLSFAAEVEPSIGVLVATPQGPLPYTFEEVAQLGAVWPTNRHDVYGLIKPRAGRS